MVSRHIKAGLALMAGGLLTPAGAVDTPVVDPAPVYAPVPRSTLVSRPDLPFMLARVQRGASQVTLLAHQPAGGDPTPVALMSATPSAPAAEVSVRLLRSNAADAEVSLATLEHLYAWTMRQDPEARFCFSDRTEPGCAAAGGGSSHAEFLRELAATRNAAAGSVPWHVVSMAPAVSSPGDADRVGVRVMSDRGPLDGASVFFNRAPHSGCVAKSRADGVAACVLVDQHGDEESHAEEGKVPVIATFPGDVRAGQMLVPTTLVLRPAP